MINIIFCFLFEGFFSISGGSVPGYVTRGDGRKAPKRNKKRESYLHRTATTSYPCYVPVLGEFRGSWSCKTFPLQRYKNFLNYSSSVLAKGNQVSTFSLALALFSGLMADTTYDKAAMRAAQSSARPAKGRKSGIRSTGRMK